jgi:hypothetical protein
MAAVHATFAHVSELARRSRRAGGREAGGGDRRPPQFRIQSECALTFKNASSGQNLSAVRTAHVSGGAHAVELCVALDRCRVQARSLRTNVTCVWDVSDPLQLDHGAKKGGWQRGSLTPHLSPTATLTAYTDGDAGGHRAPPTDIARSATLSAISGSRRILSTGTW